MKRQSSEEGIKRAAKIESIEEMEEIINKTEICHIGFTDNNKPYVLPFNFGYENKILYLHSATEGRKNNILANNNNVCVCFDTDQKLFYRDKPVACSYGMKYRSVLISGRIHIIEDLEEKLRIMNIIMKKYAGAEFQISQTALRHVQVYKIEAENITGKKYGY